MIEKLVILVLYNCKINDSQSFITFSKSLEAAEEKASLFIYDNSTNSQSIVHEDANWKNIFYTHDSLNSGLSRAYNKGSEYATLNNNKWIILLDQDTSFNEDYINKLNVAIKNHFAKLYAPILKLKNGNPFSPVVYKHKRGYTKHFEPGEYSLKEISPVNSGLCINLKAFIEVGGYNDEIKLDFADFQFIEKFKARYNKFVLINSIAYQDFSNDEINFEKSFNRFKFYIDGAKKCLKYNYKDHFMYFYSVLRHTIALSLKFKNFKFIDFFFLNYFNNK